jgi:hypothetical protein
VQLLRRSGRQASDPPLVEDPPGAAAGRREAWQVLEDQSEANVFGGRGVLDDARMRRRGFVFARRVTVFEGIRVFCVSGVSSSLFKMHGFFVMRINIGSIISNIPINALYPTTNPYN